MLAVSQAPSPELNPNSPLPVKTTVGVYATVAVDRAHLGRTRRRRKAVRSAQSYSDSPVGRPKPFGFSLIKAPLRELGLVRMY